MDFRAPLLPACLRALLVAALLLAAAGAGAQRTTADPSAVAPTAPAAVQALPQLRLPLGTLALPRVAVRNYIGTPAAEAQAGLTRDGLKPELEAKPSSRPRGEVTEQQPSSGEVARGSIVHLQVSDGSLVLVPDLRGRDVAVAQRQARAQGLGVRLELRETDAAPAGQVLRQDRRPGTEVARGTVLALLVAQPAKPPPPVWLPSYVGLPEDVARRALRELTGAGSGPPLRVRSEPQASSAPAQRVVRQVPANENVPRGSLVTLYLSDASLVLVPDVRRQDEATARTRLDAAGLRVVRRERAAQQRPGTVVAQAPAPGTEVRRDSEVTVVLAVAPRPAAVWVPSFVGQQEDAARAGLRESGGAALDVRSVAEPSAAPARRVIAQEPANESVPPGSVVTLHVSDASLVVVPEVRRVDAPEAVERLRSEGLRAVRQEKPSDAQPPGRVLAQSPPAGDEVPRDSEVTITVAALVPPPATPGGNGAGTAGPPGGGTAGSGAAGGGDVTGGGDAPDAGQPRGDGALDALPALVRDAPWGWLLAGAGAGSFVMWAARALRARRTPQAPQASAQPQPQAQAPRPTVHAEWRGPAQRPALSSPAGAPARLSLEVSGPRASERPQARIAQVPQEASHA